MALQLKPYIMENKKGIVLVNLIKAFREQGMTENNANVHATSIRNMINDVYFEDNSMLCAKLNQLSKVIDIVRDQLVNEIE